MKSPRRRFVESVAAALLGWAIAVLGYAVVTGGPIRLIPANRAFAIALLAAILIGALLRYFVDTRSVKKRHG